VKKPRLWLNDLKSGKNAEVYITLAVATIVIVFDLLGVIDQKFVAAAILLLLALLAFSNLNTRHDLNLLNEAVSTLKNNENELRFLKKRKQVGTIDKLIAKARYIDLSMMAGHFVLLDFEPWEQKLQEGATIRLLFANPSDDEHICTLTSRSDPMTEGHVDDLQRDIIRAVRKLVSIQKKNYPGRLEIRFQHIVPAFGIFAVDPDSPDGVIKIEMYPYRVPIATRPHFFLKRNRDGEWYEMFHNQFEEQWKKAVEIDSVDWQALEHSKIINP